LRGPHQRDEGRAHQGERRELDREPLYGPGREAVQRAGRRLCYEFSCTFWLKPSRPVTPIFASLVSCLLRAAHGPRRRSACFGPTLATSQGWHFNAVDPSEGMGLAGGVEGDARGQNIWPLVPCGVPSEEARGWKAIHQCSLPTVRKNGQRCRLVSRKVLREPWRAAM